MGVITLLLACVLGVGWIRSLSIQDIVIVEDARYGLWSAIGGIQWNWKYKYEVPGNPVEWSSHPITTADLRFLKEEYGFPSVTYATIVFPLIVISAWLQFSRSRTSRRSTHHSSSQESSNLTIQQTD